MDTGKTVERFYRRREVEQLTGLATSTLYEQIASGRFPKPVPIGVQSVAWRESEIAAWQQDRINARESGA
jgi:prophage regulatory protein